MKKQIGRRSIFRALFVPVICIMIFQAVIFYVAAVYGGIEQSLSQNAADILSERVYSRKTEVETRFNSRWTELEDCVHALDSRYALYEELYGGRPLASDPQRQISFLGDCGDSLIDALRYSETNGVFLILNSFQGRQERFPAGGVQTYGLCIRDMDQDSNYSGREDLSVERSPSSIIDALGCSLDSWWEARYSFESFEQGDYFFQPLNAAFGHVGADGEDLAYLSGVHQISGSDPKMISYSIPLISRDGYPYGVLGVELSVKYLASLLPSRELNEDDKGCYTLALQKPGSDELEPIVGTGAMYSRCFGDEGIITCGDTASTGGFAVTGRDGTELYASSAELEIFNHNNPLNTRRLVLLAMVDSDALFSYIGRIKLTLVLVALVSLFIGIVGLTVVSRSLAAPITALSRRVRDMDEARADYRLERLGITEIDQLVTAIEELNRNVSRNSARTEFFSRMSHDMRTPMNAIISFSSPELLEGADEAAKDDYLENIHSSGEYLLGLINEVLDMTKIESDKTELHPSAVRADRLFDTTVPVIEKLAQAKGVTFTADVFLPGEQWVMADVQHLSQIFINLLSNAVKFTPAGGEVCLCAQPEEGGNCRITVRDTGVGMSEDFMKRLYTPFAQENGNHEGTGLGLAIAKKLVELMGGSIDCASRQDVGTTFTVVLPLPPAPAPAAGTQPGERPGERQATDLSALRGRRVLVCEDNSINTRIIVHLLERVGLTADVAENGAAGVEKFRQSGLMTYSAVLMDIRMPVMDGLDATRAIRALDREDAPTVPMIAMTADAFVEDAAVSLAAGMNEHLSKPIEPDKLYAALLRHIK